MKDKILFFKPSDSTFIMKDQAFLTEHYHTIPYLFKQGKNLSLVIEFIKQIIFILKHISKCESLFIWFSDYHSFLPTLIGNIYNKKVMIVLGGADTTYIREYQYGVFSNILRSFCAKKSIEFATYLLPVDISLIKRLTRHIQNIKTKVKVVPTGYNPENWYCDTIKKNQAITVAKYSTWNRLMIKGIDRVLKIAKTNQKIHFIIIGGDSEGNRALQTFEIPKNVSLLPACDSHKLRSLYSESKYYLQLSRSEGLPNAVCEAMLCKCIPICSNVGGMPSLVSNLGYIIQDFQKPTIIELSKIEYTEDLGQKLSSHIKANYLQSRREKLLLEVLSYQT